MNKKQLAACEKAIKKNQYILPGNPKEINMWTQKALHYTLIFQTFLFLQVFNLINSRKIAEDEMNVFAGFCDNCMFSIVLVLITGIQIALVEVGGKFAKTYKLNTFQNAICIGIGALAIVWGFILKQTPLDMWKLSCLDFDCTEDELLEHNEVDDDGERVKPLRSETFKKSMAQKKSAAVKAKEQEIMTKVKSDLARRMSGKLKNLGSKVNIN